MNHPHQTIDARARGAKPRKGSLRWVVWCLVGFGACRTNLPEETYYTGNASGGATPSSGGSGVAGAAGSLAGGSAGTTVSEETGGVGGDGVETGGSGGGSDEPEVELVDCGSAPVSEAPFTRRALREAAMDCAVFHFCGFENTARVLDARVRAFVGEPSEARLASARDAWKDAMAVWSTVELFQFGPLASRSVSAGKDGYQGQGLRESIYAWPSVGRCRVEEQVASQSYLDRGLDGVLISGRGLYALEYLLFYPGADTSCAAASATARTWASLDPAELSSRKTSYAQALAADVSERAAGLREAFLPSADFRALFVDATGYPSEQEALNVLAWALVYVEREVKDWKVGRPAGYTLTSPVSEDEALYSGVATENIRNNLRGFRSLFQGCGSNGEGIGFDDWLIEAGHGELAENMIEAWQGAQDAADAFPPLGQASVSEVQAFHATLKVLTDLLKTELFGAGSPLNLKLPAGLASDTD